MKKQSGRDLRGWVLSIILSVTAQAWAVLPTNEKSDVLLSTMQQELQRAQSSLGKLDPAPYFLSYSVYDQSVSNVIGSQGALITGRTDKSAYRPARERTGSLMIMPPRKMKSMNMVTKRKKKKRNKKIAVLTAFLAYLLAGGVGAQAKDWRVEVNDDPVLQAMRDELDRAKSYLKLDRVAPPYYIEYRIIDSDNFSAEASFGALRLSVRSHVRVLRVSVRVGDYKQDGDSGKGEFPLTTVDLMPLDDDIQVLRHQLWLATDQAYKRAAEALAAKQAQLAQYNIDQPVDDFAHAEPVHAIGTLAKIDFDPQPWTAMLRDASALYKSDPRIQNSDSSLRFETVNRYYFNSEGTVVRSGGNLFQMHISCGTQADDGMSLQRNHGFFALDMKELPPAAEYVAYGVKLAGTLKDLRDAHVPDEEYRGPVLFSADAAATVFADFVGENILARRPAGDDIYIDNRPTLVPHSIVAPSMLFDELVVKRANTNKERLPEYPAPTVGAQ